MSGLIALSFILLIALAGGGGRGVAPETWHDLGLSGSAEAPLCREPTDGEKRDRGLVPKGKVATFSIDGEYLCETRLFRYGERGSFADFVLREAGGRAREVARRAAILAEYDAGIKGKPWRVAAIGQDELSARVRGVYVNALAEALGPGRVLRASKAPRDETDGGVGEVLLWVRLRQVPAADLLFDVTATARRDHRVRTWRL